MKPNNFRVLIVIPLLGLFISACDKLRPGYYLTPENYPNYTAQPSQTPLPAVYTDTPVSTPMQAALPVVTLTPTSPTASPTVFICQETTGQIVETAFTSSLTNRELRYRIYLPPCYAQTQRRYPVLILMHGLVPGTDLMDDEQWVKLGITEAADRGYVSGALPPMIIIMPNGNDANHGDDNSVFGTIVATELIPEVDKTYCAWDAPSARAIGGLSRGGFWAFSIALLYPELFIKVGGHSPFLYDGDTKVYNPYDLVDTAPNINHLVIYIDHGAQDYVRPGVQDFIDKLQRRGVIPQYVVNSAGGHTEDYWAAHVSDYLAFYGADWPRSIEELPECETATP